MKIQTALSLWLFVFSSIPVVIVGYLALTDMQESIPYAIAALLLAIVIASTVGGRLLFAPVRALVDSFKKMKPGDPEPHLLLAGRNELAEAARSVSAQLDCFRARNDLLQKKLEDMLDRESQYRFALGLQGDICYEAEADSGILATDESKWFSHFNEPPPKTYRDLLKKAGHLIHPEEYDYYMSTFNKANLRRLAEEGTYSASIEARLINGAGDFLWARHRLLLVPDKTGRLSRLIGTMENIEEQRRQDVEKTIRYQKDGLTGLYTKVVAEKLIEDYLSGDGRNMKHALLVIDIDNFKAINDTYGHLYGDAILKELSAGMTGLFRYSDIVGRIGGDEFVVLLKHITLTNLMPEKADALLGLFDEISRSKDTGERVSGSVGIATYPKDGTTFRELFTKADKALYIAKKSGKCAYCFYDENVETEKLRSRVCLAAEWNDGSSGDEKANAAVVCMERKPSKFMIAEIIFQILYESQDLEKSISLIMETVGRYCNVSRVYVFQNTADGRSARYTHEWCADGIRQDIGLIETLDYGIWGDYIQYFDKDGVFYCTDTSALPQAIYEAMRNEGVFAFLECAIYKEGAFIGFVGFDECTGKRLWKKDEIDTLILVAKILGLALRSIPNSTAAAGLTRETGAAERLS